MRGASSWPAPAAVKTRPKTRGGIAAVPAFPTPVYEGKFVTLRPMPSVLEERVLGGFSRVHSALPPGLGQSALAHSYAVRERWPAGTTRRRRFAGSVTLELDLGDRTQLKAWLERAYSLEILRYAARTLSSRGVVLDVGASIGLITFPLLGSRPDLIVHAFEPNPVNIAGWRRNRELNEAGTAVLVESAVGAQPGRARLTVMSDHESGYIEPEPTGEIAVITVDDYVSAAGIDRVELLKLDTEGHEFAALQGASRLLEERRVARIVYEFNEHHLARAGITERDVERWLGERGFVRRPLAAVGARRLRKRSISGDAVFELA